ncbi:hypothetical protein [Paenibacillus pectinilyticus]|uniref:hypothetical protein n=1 Tax=Paenibacillus pectinilyticus TaxID=512399 RepID=UPI00114CAAA5|nr:hypothetical protein [Paenibacillus pectinilyticus]
MGRYSLGGILASLAGAAVTPFLGVTDPGWILASLAGAAVAPFWGVTDPAASLLRSRGLL